MAQYLCLGSSGIPDGDGRPRARRSAARAGIGAARPRPAPATPSSGSRYVRRASTPTASRWCRRSTKRTPSAPHPPARAVEVEVRPLVIPTAGRRSIAPDRRTALARAVPRQLPAQLPTSRPPSYVADRRGLAVGSSRSTTDGRAAGWRGAHSEERTRAPGPRTSGVRVIGEVSDLWRRSSRQAQTCCWHRCLLGRRRPGEGTHRDGPRTTRGQQPARAARPERPPAHGAQRRRLVGRDRRLQSSTYLEHPGAGAGEAGQAASRAWIEEQRLGRRPWCGTSCSA